MRYPDRAKQVCVRLENIAVLGVALALFAAGGWSLWFVSLPLFKTLFASQALLPVSAYADIFFSPLCFTAGMRVLSHLGSTRRQPV